MSDTFHQICSLVIQLNTTYRDLPPKAKDTLHHKLDEMYIMRIQQTPLELEQAFKEYEQLITLYTIKYSNILSQRGLIHV